jgi:hypothetical protein
MLPQVYMQKHIKIKDEAKEVFEVTTMILLGTKRKRAGIWAR